MILPNLEKGIHVVSDRYKISTLAYQSSQGIDINELIEMHSGLIIPDITFIIDVPVDVAIERMKRDLREEHKFEANFDFLEKVRRKHLEIPSLFPNEKIIVIDGNKSIDEVFKEIKKKFHENINL